MIISTNWSLSKSLWLNRSRVPLKIVINCRTISVNWKKRLKEGSIKMTSFILSSSIQSKLVSKTTRVTLKRRFKRLAIDLEHSWINNWSKCAQMSTRQPRMQRITVKNYRANTMKSLGRSRMSVPNTLASMRSTCCTRQKWSRHWNRDKRTGLTLSSSLKKLTRLVYFQSILASKKVSWPG